MCRYAYIYVCVCVCVCDIGYVLTHRHGLVCVRFKRFQHRLMQLSGINTVLLFFFSLVNFIHHIVPIYINEYTIVTRLTQVPCTTKCTSYSP